MSRSVDAAAALSHVDALLRRHASLSETHLSRLAGLSHSTIFNARAAGRLAPESALRLLAVTDRHVTMIPPPLAPAQPVRAHLDRLMEETGQTAFAIARAAGVSHETVYNILRMTHRTLERPVFETLMRVDAAQVRNATAWEPRRPTIVRLRALQAAGWPLATLSRDLGINASKHVRTPEEQPVTVEVADRVRRAFDSIGDRPGPSRVSARRARALGYLPPINYDDDMRLIAFSEAEREASRAEDARLALIVLSLTLRGLPTEQVAARCGLSDRSVSRIRTAAGVRQRPAEGGGRVAVDQRPGAIRAIAAAVVGIDVESPSPHFDDDGIDYVERIAMTRGTPGEDAA